MVSTFTPNLNLEEPARGDDVGTWDTPVNGNTTLLDLSVGGYVAISLNNSPVVLSTPQFQCSQLFFGSTLTGDVAITFPSTFRKQYLVFNACTGSSAYVVTLTATAAGSQTVGVPFGEAVMVYNFANQGGLFFMNLGRIGSYMDYVGSSVPRWVTACTQPPYLNCDGSAVSSGTYPTLWTMLPGGVLPDRRGTTGYTLNQGTGRLTAASGGLDGNTLLATKITDSVTIGTSNLPPYTPAGSVTVTATGTIPISNGTVSALQTQGAATANITPANASGNWTGVTTVSGTLTGTPQGGVSDPMPAIGTGTVYGICMIRAG